MMKWEEKRILFYMYNNAKGIDKHNMQQIAMAAAGSLDGSHSLIKKFLSEDYIIRDESKFKLSHKSEGLIKGLYLNSQNLMLNVKSTLHSNFNQIVEIKGGVTGLYFTYTEKLHMFRFHPEEHKERLILRVRLPNLLGDIIDNKSNEFYLSEETLKGTTLLFEIVKAHINMIDECDSESA